MIVCSRKFRGAYSNDFFDYRIKNINTLSVSQGSSNQLAMRIARNENARLFYILIVTPRVVYGYTVA
jgi:hypothetical protein